MDRVRVEKPRTTDTEQGSLVRSPAIDEPSLWAGLTRIPADSSTGWHHHGTNTTVFYMLAGSITVEHGDDHVETVTADEGDFVVVPAGVVHREVVPPDQGIEAVVMRFGDGTGPLVVDVDR